MYISKQISGGRGEYEIAGDFRELGPTDLLNRELQIFCGDGIGYRSTGIALFIQGGKRRLRRLDEKIIQIHRQIEATLLLPKSTRDERQLGEGNPVICLNRYMIDKIYFDNVQLTSDIARVKLRRIELANQSNMAEELDFEARLGRVLSLYERNMDFPAPIREALEQHRDLLSAADQPLTKATENIVNRLMFEAETIAPDYDLDYVYGTDVLAALESMIELPKVDQPEPIESIEPEDFEIRRRETAKWRRWAAARGVASATFRRQVREAYDSTCVVCGLKLPKNEHCRVPGVDSAHILPWAEYDLDVVANGLCLCKTHHWAFDQQLIAVVSELPSTYRVVVTSQGLEALRDHPESLAILRQSEGIIPENRLPKRAADRPRPEFLNRLYEAVEIDLP